MSRWWCNGCAIIKPGFLRLSFWNLKYGLFVVINLILTSYLVSIGNKNLVKDLGFASVFYSAYISYILTSYSVNIRYVFYDSLVVAKEILLH